MQKYTQQLLSDIESIILRRWRECVPHYYQAGIPDPYLKPPKGLDVVSGMTATEEGEAIDFDLKIAEMEQWLEGEKEYSMFSQFGLIPEQFPPQERLSDNQLDDLVVAIRRLWAAFNFSATIPRRTPARVVYPMLLEKMLEACTVVDYGHIGIEFCDYEPERCPFGRAYCDCVEFLESD